MSKELQQLKAVPLFSTCSDREIASIGQYLKEVSYPAGQAIMKEGQTGAGLHIILEGEVKVILGGRGDQRLGPGTFFGEIALLDSGPRSATVVAQTPVRSLALSSWNLKGALKAHPSVAIKMLEEMARRLPAAELGLCRPRAPTADPFSDGPDRSVHAVG